MNKAERVLTLFWQLYSGKRISKEAFCMDMNVDTRTFDRYIEAIRNFLSEVYAGQEIVFDRKDKCYLMTGVTRKALTEVEYTAIAAILGGSQALRKDEMGGLMKSLAGVAECKDQRLKQDFLDMSSHERQLHQVPILKMQWDLFKCIERGLLIRLHFRGDCEQGGGKNRDEGVLPRRVYYENGYFKLKAVALEGGESEYWIDEIESFDIVRELTEQERERYQKKVR